LKKNKYFWKGWGEFFWPRSSLTGPFPVLLNKTGGPFHMKTKEFTNLIKAITTLVHLVIVYFTLTWGYELLTFIVSTLAKPFLGGA
jgi:hypothetical protein